MTKPISVSLQLGGTNAALEVHQLSDGTVKTETLYSGRNGVDTFFQLLDLLAPRLTGATSVFILVSFAGKVEEDGETVTVANFSVGDIPKKSKFNFKNELLKQLSQRSLDPQIIHIMIMNDAVAQLTYSAENNNLKEGEACAHCILGTGYGIVQGNVSRPQGYPVAKLIHIVAEEWGHRPMPHPTTWIAIEGIRRLTEEDPTFPGVGSIYAPAEAFVAGRDSMATTLENLQDNLEHPEDLRTICALFNKITSDWGVSLDQPLTPALFQSSHLFKSGAVFKGTEITGRPIDYFLQTFSQIDYKKELNVFITLQAAQGDLLAQNICLFTAMRGAEAVALALTGEKIRSLHPAGQGANVEKLAIVSISGSLILNIFKSVSSGRKMFENVLRKHLKNENIEFGGTVLNETLDLDGTSWLARKVLYV